MESLQFVVAMSLIVKTIVDNLKPLWDIEESFSRARLASLLVSVFMFTLFGVNVFDIMGFDIPYFDGVIDNIIEGILTGVLIAGGANVVFDIVKNRDSALFDYISGNPRG